MEGKFVLIRTENAGVHFGLLEKKEGREVTLKDARRLWRWSGAHSLHEVATKGVDKDYSRISEPVPEILLTEAIELIPCSDAARENLIQSRWG